MVLFDIDSFLEIERFELGGSFTGQVEELFFAGQERLGFLTSDGEAGIIEVPGLIVPVPEPSALLFSIFSLSIVLRRKR